MPPTLADLLEPQRERLFERSPRSGRYIYDETGTITVRVPVGAARDALGAPLHQPDPDLGQATYEAHERFRAGPDPCECESTAWADLPAGDRAHWAAVEAATERHLAHLLMAHLQRDIDTMHQQAEHWHAEGGHPLAVHHRMTKASAYQQVLYLLQRLLRWGESPVADVRRRLAYGQPLRGEATQPGPHLHAYGDPCYAAMLFAKQPLQARAERASDTAAQTIYALYRNEAIGPERRGALVRNAVIDALNTCLATAEGGRW